MVALAPVFAPEGEFTLGPMPDLELAVTFAGRFATPTGVTRACAFGCATAWGKVISVGLADFVDWDTRIGWGTSTGSTAAVCSTDAPGAGGGGSLGLGAADGITGAAFGWALDWAFAVDVGVGTGVGAGVADDVGVEVGVGVGVAVGVALLAVAADTYGWIGEV